MLYDGKTYILDAKYYKYGITRIPTHLPASDSIQKQITYGNYVVTEKLADKEDVYNAFVMPFESKTDKPYEFVSIGTGDWIDYNNEKEKYKYVLGILFDTRYAINTYAKHNLYEIEELSKLIEKSIELYLSGE